MESIVHQPNANIREADIPVVYPGKQDCIVYYYLGKCQEWEAGKCPYEHNKTRDTIFHGRNPKTPNPPVQQSSPAAEPSQSAESEAKPAAPASTVPKWEQMSEKAKALITSVVAWCKDHSEPDRECEACGREDDYIKGLMQKGYPRPPKPTGENPLTCKRIH